MESRGERLKWARKKAGYETATAAAEAFGWKVPTYLSHENGSRGFTNPTAQKYARAFRIDRNWLFTGEGTPNNRPRKLKLFGYVGGGAEITPVDDHAMGEGIDTVDAPPRIEYNEEIAVVRVRGDSMWPAYNDGDLIYYGAPQTDPSVLLGRECVVKLDDDKMFVKILAAKEGRNSYTLTSHNAPPRTGQRVVWAAKVRWVEKA